MSVVVQRKKPKHIEELNRALEQGKALGNDTVGKVGWLENSKYTDEKGRTESVAEIAAQNELGNSAKGIPPRPAIRNAIKANTKKWRKEASFVAYKILLGKYPANSDYMLKVIGLVARSDIQNSIYKLTEPPLAPATIKNREYKKRRGIRLFGGLTKPLVESGVYASTIVSVVEKK